MIGKKTTSGDNTKKSKIDEKNENEHISPRYFNLFIILTLLLHFILPIKKIIYPPLAYFGFIFIILGLILNILSVRALRKMNTTVEFHDTPITLVTNGPFRFSRNPIYLSGIIILLGLAILLGSLITLIFPILLFIILNEFYIPLEEKTLEKMFGKEYLIYKMKVRKWI